MNKSILAVAVASLLPYAPFTQAQQSSADETVVVTANRFEQVEGKSLSNIEVVTRQDIDQMQAKTLPDVLRRLTGVQVTQNGGRGQLASLYVRGTNSDQVLVLVDGIRFARAAKGSVDFNQIPLTYVQRVEYVRGARASLYGSEAIGGVINIITIARAEDEGTKMSAGLGSLDYQELSLASGIKISESGQLNFALGRESDEGYNVKPIEGLNDGDRHGFETVNGLLGYVHQFDQHWSAYLNVRAYDNVYQYDTSSSSRGTHGYSEAQKDNLALTAGGKYQSQKLVSELLYTTQKQKEWNYVQSEGKDSGSIGELDQQNVQWTNSWLFTESVILAGGLDWRDESYTDKNANETFDRSNVAAFGVLTAQFDDALFEGSLRFDDNEEFGEEFTYSLGAGYQFIPQFGLKASFGTAFKAPNLYQQYDPYYGTKDLKAESSDSWELTFEGEVQQVNWSITGYDYKINDLIDWSPSGYENLQGETHIQGLELVAEFGTGIVYHQLSADFKDAEDSEGNQLSRRAEEMYKWNALVSFEAIDWSIGYQYVGKRPDGSEELYSYSLVDTAVSYYANESVTISARVDNLLDKEYQTARGYPAAERSYYLNVSYQF
ncbi:TonB-dependent vitamin B12 receptor [Vibrio intestinalis]|uniref:TonB-dependent vitamin B12 receptor n=1 Tax=Vibrio intestinalis TaxID=2933291 RepID=UPI0021A8CD2B|nr:TonB-dependent vitamin B12 receptor [Vibrio intestinalis]